MENPKLPEDCVEYNIFLVDKNGVVKKDFTEIRPQLEQFCLDAYSSLAKYLVDYIWQKEPLHLAPFKRPFSHIGGRTNFGDSIEDEWFIVYLMLELSKQFPDSVISISDDDGQFLLIEAAEYLPAWLGPENSDNRVWIHRGRIHIIPEVVGGKHAAGSNGEEEVSVEEALAWLGKDPEFTLASKEIEGIIQQRIAGYPRKIADLQHRFHCCVPAAVAVLMKLKPSLLSAAIDAFYLRDPIDLRACKAMKHFPPETRVLSDIVTSKLQYAQLLQQKYSPDKRTGWDLPMLDDPHYKVLDLGVKIASGFEILCSYGERVQGKMRVVAYEELDSDKEWLKFQSVLEKAHYLNPAQKTASMLDRLHKAKDFFMESHHADDGYIPKERLGAIVLHLLRTVDIDIDALKRHSLRLPPPDDDSWLHMTSDQVDTMLASRMSATNGNKSAATNGSDFDPALITESIKRFMELTSGLEGAEFADEKDDHNSMDTSHIDQAIGKILELHISEDEDDGRNSSAMTDYSDEEQHVFDMPRGSRSELENIQAYLQKMDHELARTAVGQSFVREKDLGIRKPVNTTAVPASNGRSIPAPDRKNSAMAGDSSESIDDENDSDYFRPVSLDVNLLKNILESCSSEQGLPGPASNLLKRMRVHLPPNKDT